MESARLLRGPVLKEQGVRFSCTPLDIAYS